MPNSLAGGWNISEFDFTIHHLPGILNTAADALTRGTSTVTVDKSFQLIQLRHTQYGHPGVNRLLQLLKNTKDAHNISNAEEICRKVTTNCRVCAQIKPRWVKPPVAHVIKSTSPWQRLSLDFMTNKPLSPDGYCNILTVIDEYSHFPFVFSTKDRSSNTVMNCLKSLFTLFGPPATIHSDRGPEFFSIEFSAFLSHWGIQHSRTTAYHPAGNGQTERYNGTIWKTVQSILADRQLPDVAWPTVLSEALHCIRSLINTTTGEMPHERFCVFPRSYYPVPNNTIPLGSYAWLRRHTRHKNDPSGDLVKIVASYPGYAVISRDGKSMDTVNWRHLAPHPGPSSTTDPLVPHAINVSPATDTEQFVPSPLISPHKPASPAAQPLQHDQPVYTTRYGRSVRQPIRLGFSGGEECGIENMSL